MESKDTVEQLKKEIEEKEIVINNHFSSIQEIDPNIKEILESQEFDKNYFQKAAVEIDYRIKHGNPDGQYIEPEPELPKEPEKPKHIYKKKSKWQILKENFKKVVL